VFQVGSGVGLAALSAIAAACNHQHAAGAGLLPGYHTAEWAAAATAGLGTVTAALAIHRTPPASSRRTPVPSRQPSTSSRYS
jgi:hypothetical protein